MDYYLEPIKSRETSIDPEKLLESIGIDDYSIDWDEKAIYLNRRALETVAGRFGKRITNDTEGIRAAGWRWKEVLPDEQYRPYQFDPGRHES